METTPLRAARARDLWQALTPAAKRAPPRVHNADSQCQNMSIEQMSQILQNVREQYDLDMQWVTELAEIVEDHAARLDQHWDIIKHGATDLLATQQFRTMIRA